MSSRVHGNAVRNKKPSGARVSLECFAYVRAFSAKSVLFPVNVSRVCKVLKFRPPSTFCGT